MLLCIEHVHLISSSRGLISLAETQSSSVMACDCDFDLAIDVHHHMAEPFDVPKSRPAASEIFQGSLRVARGS